MPETYRSPHTGTIADLMGRRGRSAADVIRAQGEAEAQRALASGQAWGGAIQNIAGSVGGTLRDLAQHRMDAPNRELRQQQSDLLAKQLGALETAQAQTEIGRLAQMVKASGYDPSTAEPLFRAIGKLSPEYEAPLMRSLMEPEMLKTVTDTLITQVPGYKAPEPERPITVNGRLVDPTGKVLYEPPPEPEKPVTVGGRLVKPSSGEVVYEPPPEPEKPTNPTEASLAMMAAQGNQQAANALERLRSLRGSQQERSGYFTQTPLYDAQGRPVGVAVLDARTGKIEIKKPEDLGGAVTARPPGNLGQRTIENEAALDSLQRLKAMFDAGAKGQIGPAEGRARALTQGFPGGVSLMESMGANPKRFADFEAATRAFQNAMIKAITGAQMSEPEAKRIMGQIPSTADHPDVWQSKYTQSVENLKDLERRTRTDREDPTSTPADPLGIRPPGGS